MRGIPKGQAQIEEGFQHTEIKGIDMQLATSSSTHTIHMSYYTGIICFELRLKCQNESKLSASTRCSLQGPHEAIRTSVITFNFLTNQRFGARMAPVTLMRPETKSELPGIAPKSDFQHLF